MDEQAVREFVTNAQSIIDASPQMDEANTKAAVLRDFLDLLGWEIPTNTQLEYSVEAFGRTYKVDYALILEETPVAFLEAKGVDTPLTADHDEQLSSYMMNRNVNYGILTNGKQYRFFQRRVAGSNVDVQMVGDATLGELPDQLTVLQAYRKSAIETGESGKILGRINELRQARQTLEARKDDLSAELADVLADRVSETIASLAESQSKELIDRVIADIEGEIDGDDAVSFDESDEMPPTVSETPAAVSGDYVIKIQDDETTLSTFADNTQSDVMAEAVNYLVENHDLISELEPLPYVPGKKTAIINSEPVHPDGEREMRMSRELTGNYHLCTSLDKKSKQRYVRRFSERCGLTVAFGGEW